MSRHAVLSIALVAAVLATLLGTPVRPVEAAPARPDIVLFYIDDWAPYPDRMWSTETRTPELARFADRGLQFTNAIAATPLCGPARANLLTGRYGHNTGVTQNLMNPYSGNETVSAKLRNVGYRTAFVGKHMNGLARSYPTRSRMGRLASKWDHFDVIWHNQGRFYDWRQYRKSGTSQFGRAASDHSSYQAAKRAASVIKSTPSNKPLFMVVSLFDGHVPRTPMARFKGHRKCSSIKPWQGPAYMEKDVSDKPRYIRQTKTKIAPGFKLNTRCQEAMTVDWVVGQVRAALVDTGRAANTLQVLTADNGFLMGDHRLIGKGYPYDTWVPLYMRWPKVLGNKRRYVEEPVSNVDLGKTFCALAGCRMPASDGLSMVPLIKGWRTRLDRSFVYSEMLHAGPRFGSRADARPAWIQIQSTRRYSDRLWSFTRYQTGEEELYDLTGDPHRLKNLAYKPAYADVRSDLRAYWQKVRAAGDVSWKGNLR